jgi:NADP-dependent 3-hydroxy acid dehydrogenase YdfG
MERGSVCVNLFVTGGSSGVGQACVELFDQHRITAPTRNELDLSDFEAIAQLDLSQYDIVINCAGANAGAFRGWQDNTWQNQQNQVDVNFTGALLLAKQYVQQRATGHFIYITSSNIDDPIVYNIFYTAAKAALHYSMNTVKKQYPNVLFTEIRPGKIRSNMLKQNYQGAKTPDEIEKLYAKGPALTPADIAEAIATAIKYKIEQITITPHDKS